MMTTLIAYFDKKLGVYLAPITVHDEADEVIIEDIRRMCANPQMPKVYFEYDLYKIGKYDDKVGSIETFEKPVFLVSLNDYRHLAEGDVENVN